MTEHSTVKFLYNKGAQKLRDAGVEQWQNEAYLLLQYILDCSRSDLILAWEGTLNPDELAAWNAALQRRCQREPLQHITGVREFFSLDFFVSPAVLIPRPETEFLLEKALPFIRGLQTTAGPLLDMCTGSGVIAVVLARETEKTVVAVDSSLDALHIAQKNVQYHKVEDRVQLLCSDLFTALQPQQQFSCILANPPYIAADELAALEPEVRNFEPYAALSDGHDGLQIIARILEIAPFFLEGGGWLFMEIGASQKEAVERMTVSPFWCNCEVLSDYAGRPRVLRAQKAC